jgi:hypothetical protein
MSMSPYGCRACPANSTNTTPTLASLCVCTAAGEEWDSATETCRERRAGGGLGAGGVPPRGAPRRPGDAWPAAPCAAAIPRAAPRPLPDGAHAPTPAPAAPPPLRPRPPSGPCRPNSSKGPGDYSCQCDAGYYRNIYTFACDACPDGATQPMRGQTSCVCPTGKGERGGGEGGGWDGSRES